MSENTLEVSIYRQMLLAGMLQHPKLATYDTSQNVYFNITTCINHTTTCTKHITSADLLLTTTDACLSLKISNRSKSSHQVTASHMHPILQKTQKKELQRMVIYMNILQNHSITVSSKLSAISMKSSSYHQVYHRNTTS